MDTKQIIIKAYSIQLANNISVIWPNQLQNRSQRNAHAQVYTNKICHVINQWNRPDCTLEYLDKPAVLKSWRILKGTPLFWQENTTKDKKEKRDLTMTKRSMYPFHSSVTRRQRLTEGVSEAWCFKKIFELFDSIIIYGYVYSRAARYIVSASISWCAHPQ